jgi:hypothetical protein
MGQSNVEEHRLESVHMSTHSFRWEPDQIWSQEDADEIEGFAELGVVSVEQVALYVDGQEVDSIGAVLVTRTNADQTRQQHEALLLDAQGLAPTNSRGYLS